MKASIILMALAAVIAGNTSLAPPASAEPLENILVPKPEFTSMGEFFDRKRQETRDDIQQYSAKVVMSCWHTAQSNTDHINTYAWNAYYQCLKLVDWRHTHPG